MNSLLWLTCLLLLSACAGERVVREVVATSQAPAAIGPYSQAIRVGDTLYAAGQIGLDPGSGELAPGGVAAETKRVLENLRAVLLAGGFEFADVVTVTVYLTDLNDFAAMNEVYAAYFPADPPARATVGIAELPRGARIEISLVADRSRD